MSFFLVMLYDVTVNVAMLPEGFTAVHSAALFDNGGQRQCRNGGLCPALGFWNDRG